MMLKDSNRCVKLVQVVLNCCSFYKVWLMPSELKKYRPESSLLNLLQPEKSETWLKTQAEDGLNIPSWPTRELFSVLSTSGGCRGNSYPGTRRCWNHCKRATPQQSGWMNMCVFELGDELTLKNDSVKETVCSWRSWSGLPGSDWGKGKISGAQSLLGGARRSAGTGSDDSEPLFWTEIPFPDKSYI